MKQRLLHLLVPVLVSTSMIVGCERYLDSKNPLRSVPDGGPIPSGITVEVNPQSVLIAWEVAEPAKVLRYRIYMSDSTALNLNLYDSTTSTQFSLTGLIPDRLYLVQIAPILAGGLEGDRSAIFSVRLTTLSVVINGGTEFTNSRTIQVATNSIVAVSSIIVSEDPQFSGAVYEAFALAKSFTVAEGDGAKTVYVGLTFADGSKTGTPLSDQITLDTRSIIDSVFLVSGTGDYSEGDTIIFGLDGGEIDGRAALSFVGRNVTLLDDGTQLDASADDGIYSGFFVVPPDLNAFNEVFTGSFVDRANNAAANVDGKTFLSIQTAPLPIQLSAIGMSPGQVNLTWTRTTSTDFASYRVYRNSTTIVDQNSTLIATITSSATTAFTDTDVSPGQTYYYRVFVTNVSGLLSSSEVASATTFSDDPPAAVVLHVGPWAANSVPLNWSVSTDDDFVRYRIFRSLSPSVSDQDQLVTEITNKQQTTYTTTLQGAGDFYYIIYVIDIFEQRSPGSNTWRPNPNP